MFCESTVIHSAGIAAETPAYTREAIGAALRSAVSRLSRFVEWIQLVGAGVVLVAGVGCSANLVNPSVPPAGSPAFRDAYVEGCWTGYVDAGRDGYTNLYEKNARRYGADTDYKNGWDQGYAACYVDEKEHPKIKGDGGSDFM